MIKSRGKPFLLHSCGNIFPIMEDIIAVGVGAKHSNEDVIAPFEDWIWLYGSWIGLLGGIDVDLLCIKPPDEVFSSVVQQGMRYRSITKGFVLGSGNSIPDYMPVDGYLAMIVAAKHIREVEKRSLAHQPNIQ